MSSYFYFSVNLSRYCLASRYQSRPLNRALDLRSCMQLISRYCNIKFEYCTVHSRVQYSTTLTPLSAVFVRTLMHFTYPILSIYSSIPLPNYHALLTRRGHRSFKSRLRFFPFSLALSRLFHTLSFTLQTILYGTEQ